MINNYWMKLSVVLRITMKASAGVMVITPAEAFIIVYIKQKPDSVIILLFISNRSKVID